ncbi:MAG: GNAT family N-acetyltransferase [Mediterranea sp.]|jgi:diamine N-acetyltransferase|nr:GNAT family N-acetyltransferase [Mediterranea sp.]
MAIPHFSNDRICLRAVEPEDLDVFYRMENDPELWEISTFTTVPYSRYALEFYIKNSANDIYIDKQLRLMIARRNNPTVLGTIDLTDFVPLHSRAAVGIALLEEHRGKGYAKDALSLLCNYAFDFLQLKQLYAHIPADNEASLNLFGKCGFRNCGTMKAWLQAGKTYKDVVMMQLIR